jgi:hypothetical protein
METDIEKVEFIVVKRTVTYDIKALRKEMLENGETIDEETILDRLGEWIHEDLRAPLSRHDVEAVAIDEDGSEEDLDYFE